MVGEQMKHLAIIFIILNMALISNFADAGTAARGTQHINANIKATLEITTVDNVEKLVTANNESDQIVSVKGNVPYCIQFKNSPVLKSGIDIGSLKPFSENTERYITIIYIATQDI